METPCRYSVGLVQMAMSSDAAENLARAVAGVEEAARLGAQVICLPELFRSQYFCQREDPAQFDLSEPVPGPTTAALGDVARRLGVVVVAPVFERRAAGVYHNAAAVIDADGRLAGLYRKMHIPDDPGYYEKFYFAPGDLGFPAFDTRFGRVGVLICWDQWYPEAARLAALQGPGILFYPTAIGWHPAEKVSAPSQGLLEGRASSRPDVAGHRRPRRSVALQSASPQSPQLPEKAARGAAQREAWRTIQRSHAIANGLFVAAVNRVGLERPDEASAGIEFWGSSFLCDPFGMVLAEGPADREVTLVAEVDLARVDETRRAWPFLRDRRIDAYKGLTRRFLDEPLRTP